MRKLCVLCFVTLAAVFVDIVFLHSGTVSAQATNQYEIRRVRLTEGNSFNAPGTVVGFSCLRTTTDTVECYVAAR
jgi:hypothetical protein